MNTILNDVVIWSELHGLKLNPRKTQVLRVGSERIHSRLDLRNLSKVRMMETELPYRDEVDVDYVEFDFSDRVKYLGIVFDRYLSWEGQWRRREIRQERREKWLSKAGDWFFVAAAASELEPLVDAQHADVLDAGNEDKILEETLEKPKKRKEFKTEYKKRFRPFSQYEYVDGSFIKRKHEADLLVPEPVARDSPVPHAPEIGTPSNDPWYNEVIELRKKAGEYKHRGWGTELVPEHLADIYGKQVVLWEQVSRRSSLSALSLASASPRAITKEEKEKENNKKSSPTKGLARVPGRADRVDGVLRAQVDKGAAVDDKREPRSRKEFLVRHHLERTTGAEDGSLLVSPTREKLEPAVPRRKEEDSSNKSPSKCSPKSSPRSARSQSVGPAASENRSPKRQPRTPVSTSSASAAPKATAPAERRPRPTSLNTSSATRSKSSSVAMRNSSEDKALGKSAKGAAQSGAKTKKAEPAKKQLTQPKKDDEKTSGGDTCDGGAVAQQQDLPAVHTQKPTPPSAGGSETKELPPPEELLSPDTNNTVSLIDDEPLVKSPPEPTRVKSPEQIIMRSPEPVNWTVPLDTGKTFTVTQNVREGELSRPHGESSRHWGAPASSSLDAVFEGPQEIGVAGTS
ncbi:Hypothetical predicted protein [Cloeon dipterum]|uniref:Nuclear protein MDM1 n=1 Tax=Cloeon dipterum TaxID=197152 RepID=A0A8S1DKS8_9INSE|nr:Hypothetical predicted protein [Cloeon dipterum]